MVRVCRLLKEQISYHEEAEAQKRKLDKFIADKAEDWDIKNAVRVTSIQFDCLLTHFPDLSDADDGRIK